MTTRLLLAPPTGQRGDDDQTAVGAVQRGQGVRREPHVRLEVESHDAGEQREVVAAAAPVAHVSQDEHVVENEHVEAA